jgi:hypothetical protein
MNTKVNFTFLSSFYTIAKISWYVFFVTQPGKCDELKWKLVFHGVLINLKDNKKQYHADKTFEECLKRQYYWMRNK